MSGGRGTPPPEDDLDFDAFEDEPADEPPPRSRSRGSRSRGSRPARPSRGGSRGGGSRGGGGGGAAVLQQPRARLALLLAFAAILILVIVLVVRDCQRSQLEDSYTRYLNGVAQVVNQSAEQGTQLRQIMNNPRGDKPPQLRQKIAALAGEASGLVDQAEDLDPPGALSSPQRSLVTALEYRVTGLNSLAQNLPALLQLKDEQAKAIGIAEPMQRFLASDVIYADSFVGPAGEALDKDDITGIEVPKGAAFLPNPALATPDGAKTLIPGLQRRTPAQGGDQAGTGNLRGTSLVSTEALPSETRLTPGTAVAVQASDQLKWRVTVENGGDFDESGVVVTASFSYPSSPNDVTSQEAQIDAIGSGETVSVEIPGPPADVITFGEQGTLRIEIDAVSGETNTDNNAAEYPVKITI
jgi:hypothetical protein